jgi:hypothetical protein
MTNLCTSSTTYTTATHPVSLLLLLSTFVLRSLLLFCPLLFRCQVLLNYFLFLFSCLLGLPFFLLSKLGHLHVFFSLDTGDHIIGSHEFPPLINPSVLASLRFLRSWAFTISQLLSDRTRTVSGSTPSLLSRLRVHSERLSGGLTRIMVFSTGPSPMIPRSIASLVSGKSPVFSNPLTTCVLVQHRGSALDANSTMLYLVAGYPLRTWKYSISLSSSRFKCTKTVAS